MRAVDGVTFSLPAGDVLGVVGESGCGKSTLARLILGLLPPSAGDILVDGRSLAGMDRRERAAADPAGVPGSRSPRSTRASAFATSSRLPLVAQGDLPKSQQTDRVMEMLARVGLSSEMAERLPSQLSGGQRQRVAIARALVLRPRIVVCDEPTSALDVSVQAQILNLLAELRRELGLTYLFISHNLAVVEHIATEVAVMYLGRIVEHAPTQDLFRTPEHPYTQGAARLRADAGAGSGHSRRRSGRHLSRSGQHPAGLPLPSALPERVRRMRGDRCPDDIRKDGRLVECLLAIPA